MVNKQWLIKLTGEDNLFYDSEEKVYRRRMYCPECGKVSGCICYENLEVAETDDINCCCSMKCTLIGEEWDELDEAMQEAELEKDLKECLSKLTEEQSLEELEGYELKYVFEKLLENNSEIPISHLKKPTHTERLEILWLMGDAKDILYNNDINYYKDIKDLTEEEAKKLLEILTDDFDSSDFEAPMGDFCKS